MKRVVVFAPSDCLASSITGPIDVFNIANSVWQHYEGGSTEKVFSFDIFTLNDKPVVSSSGIVITPTVELAEIGQPDILLLGAMHFQGIPKLSSSVSELSALVTFLKKIDSKTTQIGAFCTATFLVGEAGLLEKKKATTSWWLAKQFQKRYPNVEVVMDQLVVKQ